MITNTPVRLLALIAALFVPACSSPSPPPGSPSPTVASSGGIAECPAGGHLTAGTYRFDAADTMTVPATITVPDGWSGCGLLSKEFGPPAGPALIGFWLVENVYANPCHWKGALMDPAVGPTTAAMTAAMAEQELTDADAPSEATLGGEPASYVRISVPDDFALTDCDEVREAEFRFWKGPGEELTGSAVWWLGAKDAAGLIGEVWAAEIDGQRVVVQAAYFSDADQAEVDEVHAIVDSITFPR